MVSQASVLHYETFPGGSIIFDQNDFNPRVLMILPQIVPVKEKFVGEGRWFFLHKPGAKRKETTTYEILHFQDGNSMYIIQHGHVAFYTKDNPDDEKSSETEIRTLESGHFFGEEQVPCHCICTNQIVLFVC